MIKQPSQHTDKSADGERAEECETELPDARQEADCTELSVLIRSINEYRPENMIVV